MSTATETKQVYTSMANHHPTESDWLESRKSFIGASESASIFGVGYANTSPITVWSSKTGGPQPEFDEATLRRMNRDTKMEPIILAEFAEVEGVTLVPIASTGRWTCRHPEYQWLGATLDGIALHPEHGPLPVEIKAVNGRFRHDWDDDTELPLKYICQVQHQMAVTGTTHAWLVGLIGGDELVIRLIERNPRFIAVMIAKLAEFWGYVERKELPPIDESEATAKLLGKIYPRDLGQEVNLPDDAGDWDRYLIEIKEQIKELESKKTHLESQIKACIGSATRGVLPGAGSYSWKAQTREGVDAKALQSQFPEAYQACLKVSEFRVLRRGK